jgi:hypothetical protein
MTDEEMKRLGNRMLIGLTEPITIIGDNGKTKRIRARIDTGATRNSIDRDLAKELGLGPVIRTKLVKQAQGNSIRPIIVVKFRLAGVEHRSEFTVAERNHMKYKVLIGQNGLGGYLIDPNKKK